MGTKHKCILTIKCTGKRNSGGWRLLKATLYHYGQIATNTDHRLLHYMYIAFILHLLIWIFTVSLHVYKAKAAENIFADRE